MKIPKCVIHKLILLKDIVSLNTIKTNVQLMDNMSKHVGVNVKDNFKMCTI